MVVIAAALKRTNVKKEKATVMLTMTVQETLNAVLTIVHSNRILALIKQMIVVTIQELQPQHHLEVEELLNFNFLKWFCPLPKDKQLGWPLHPGNIKVYSRL